MPGDENLVIQKVEEDVIFEVPTPVIHGERS